MSAKDTCCRELGHAALRAAVLLPACCDNCPRCRMAFFATGRSGGGWGSSAAAFLRALLPWPLVAFGVAAGALANVRAIIEALGN